MYLKDGEWYPDEVVPELVLTDEEKDELYKNTIELLIRERYTISDELAILRQRDTKVQEFIDYNSFCEECKAVARNNLL